MEAAGKGGKAVREREAKEERSTGHNPEDCPVCMTVFDDTVQRPRTLPCGHTVCTLCVNKLKQQGSVSCPECRVSHTVPEGGQFPVCYVAEALIRRTRDGVAAAAASPPPSVRTRKVAAGVAGEKKAAGLSRKMRFFLQEQEASVVAAITACQEVQAQLDQYQTTLTNWGEQQQQLECRIQGLLDQSRSAREMVRQEESRAAAKKEEAREGERQLHAALEALHTPATDKEAGVAVVEMVRCVGEAEQVLEECRGSFSDCNTAITVRKVREASKATLGVSMVVQAALEALQAVQADLEAFQVVQAAPENPPACTGEEPRLQSYPDCTIVTPRLRLASPRRGPSQAEDLRSPTQPVKRLLEAGSVFGVHHVEGRRRYARISLENGRQYLHTLKEEPLPPGATVIEVSNVVQPSFPCVVFLDLLSPGSTTRRVHIRLSPDTPRGRQVALLCTGQRGPSYASTRLFKVWAKGRPGECVCGGDYERNDGSGGAALLPDLDNGNYLRSGKAGAVCGWGTDPAQGAQFVITTRNCQDNNGYGGVFGEVVQGLETLVAAAERHTAITNMTVQDCGMVL